MESRIADNPFYVLGLRPGCSRAEMEREGQKLLGMLEMGLGSSRTYDTPLGPRPRTPENVRQALAELRQPDRRAQHEQWAALPPTPLAGTWKADDHLSPWPDALRVMGWTRR